MFIIVDLSFFLANLMKIAEGGWLPLTFAGDLFLIMITWRSGIDAIRATLLQAPQSAASAAGAWFCSRFFIEIR